MASGEKCDSDAGDQFMKTSSDTIEQEQVGNELEKALIEIKRSEIELRTIVDARSRRSAVVAERNRLAREVHDTLAQGLTGVIVQLEAAGEAMGQSRPTKASGHLERASQLARESLQEARRSVRALRPQALEENSLSIALNELLAKMTADTSIRPRLLPQEWENNLLRIGQEALTNAEAMAGKLAIQSEKGRGVSISIILPVDPKVQNYEPIS